MSWRKALPVAVLALFAAVAVDVLRPPDKQLSAKALVGAIRAYQAVGSPVVRKIGARCRFEPTCSEYAVGAVRQHGSVVGSWKTAGRILRCGPWTTPGTHDPP